MIYSTIIELPKQQDAQNWKNTTHTIRPNRTCSPGILTYNGFI